MSVPANQPTRLTFKTYSDAAKTTLADATTVVLYLKDPTDGTVSTPTVTHDSPGIYHCDIPDTTSGLWAYRWVATGAVATSSRAGAVQVDEAFPPMLIGLDDARAELNFDATTDDDELQTYIYTASALLLNHPAYRVADVSRVTSYTEWANSGSDVVVLKHYPATVTTVTEYSGSSSQVITHEPLDGGSFTAYGWDYDDGTGANGILRRSSSGSPAYWCGNRVKVVYTAGSATIPWDVRLACLLLVEHLWETQRGTGGSGPPAGLEAESLAGSFGEAYGPSYILPNRVTEALAAYRKAPAVA